jgi:hypothetical protein
MATDVNKSGSKRQCYNIGGGEGCYYYLISAFFGGGFNFKNLGKKKFLSPFSFNRILNKFRT